MEIKIKVFPNSSKNKILKEKDKFLVYVKSEKKKNMANQEAVYLMAKHLGVSSDCVKIKRGQRSENKLLEIK